jgi:asparagine synthase (glutamine-hydrolysing)
MMCGIVGIVNRKEAPFIEVETLQQMMATIRHRGPDSAGIYRDRNIGLGNVRLNIIDLTGGDQPIGNEDGTLWIVYNGEVFNYIELRPELEHRGHRFSTQTDTEVILHLYEEEGPDCLKRLNGQFALAIWDSRQRSLFLARDRVGIRPLFYSLTQDQLIFASEIKAIFASGKQKAAIDVFALREVFTFWSPQSPRTIFEGVQELPPAHYMLVRNGVVEIQRYWQLDLMPETSAHSEEFYCDRLEELLIDAARIRLRADVPVGAYLSGGLDSSLTTALIHGHTHNSLNTFSIAFTDPDYDEYFYQNQMAEFLGTEHHILHCDYSDIHTALPAVVWHTETPILRTAPVPMYLLSKLVTDQNFKVVMTGEGADEFLAGYDIFKAMKIRRFWAKEPESQLRPKLLALLYPEIRGIGSSKAFLTRFFRKDLEQTNSPIYSHLVRWNNSSRNLRFLNEAIRNQIGPLSYQSSVPLPDGFDSWTALGQAQYLEILTFLSPYLLSSQGDRMAMAHSVEGRYPFLDHRVIEFCNALPDTMKLPVLTEKWLLKQLGSKYLPQNIWSRRKRPYRAPVHRSLFSPTPPEYVTELLSSEMVMEAGYFEPAAVEMLYTKASLGADGRQGLSEVEDMALIGILSTQILHQQFVQLRDVPPAIKVNDPIKCIDRIAEPI